MSLDYVLITPAHNEATFIEKTLQSVVTNMCGVQWVISLVTGDTIDV